MAIEVDLPDSFDSGENWITREGTYHFVITDASDTPTYKRGQKKGEIRAGAVFEVTASVCEGTAKHNGRCLEEGKEHDFIFYDPNAANSDNGRNMAKRKIGRLLVATGFARRDQAGGKAKFDPANLVGRQFVAKMDLSEGSDGKQYIQLSWDNIWHVDDTEVADVPKSDAHLALLPADQRLIGGKPNKPDPADANSKPAEPANVNANAVDIDDI